MVESLPGSQFEIGSDSKEGQEHVLCYLHMEVEFIFRIIEIVIQLALLFVALFALSTWKREIRGHDRFHTAKSLLEYIKNLRFLIHAKSG